MHTNEQAIALYDKLGFQRVQVFAVKRRNAINENLFTQPVDDEKDLNPYVITSYSIHYTKLYESPSKWQV